MEQRCLDKESGIILRNNKCINVIVHTIIGFLLVIVLVCANGIGAKAYTEEEKAQAKAWLSAHGYSPDAGGAAAAYQDYLNGKFDEELGITREPSTEGKTQSAYDDSDDKEEKTTQEGSDASGNDPTSTESTIWDVMIGASADEEGNASTENITKEQEPSTQIAYEEPEDTEEEIIDENATEEIEEDAENGKISLYKSENSDKYKEALVVIVLSVLACMVVLGVYSLMS